MARILVLESDAAERAFALHTLEQAGHLAWAPDGEKPSMADLENADAVVAELDSAWPPALSRRSVQRAAHRRRVALRDDAACPRQARRGRRAEAFRPNVAARRGQRGPRGAPVVSRNGDRSVPRCALSRCVDGPRALRRRRTGLARGRNTDGAGDGAERRQADFAGHVGLPPDLFANAATPRAWSFCEHAATAAAPLVVTDAREHPAFANNPVVAMNLVRAYAGVPIDVPGYGAGAVWSPRRSRAPSRAAIGDPRSSVRASRPPAWRSASPTTRRPRCGRRTRAASSRRASCSRTSTT